jgi:hypothetical protein
MSARAGLLPGMDRFLLSCVLTLVMLALAPARSQG